MISGFAIDKIYIIKKPGTIPCFEGSCLFKHFLYSLDLKWILHDYYSGKKKKKCRNNIKDCY